MLTVGQKLWWVYFDSRRVNEGREVTVTKVGRKWAELDNRDRIDVESLVADGRGYSPDGRCWVSKEAYDLEQLRLRWMRRFNEAFSWARPGFSLQQLTIAAKVLGIELKEEA
jgi:hypothetical protein